MKKHMKLAVYLLLPLIIILLAVILSWEQLFYFGLRKGVDRYAKRMHTVVTIDRLEGSPLTNTTIKKLSIQPAGEMEQNYRFKAAAVTCTYNLWDLKQGIQPFIAGMRCTAESPQFTFESGTAKGKGTSWPELSEYAVVLPELEIQNGAVILHLAGGDAEMHGVGGSLQPAPDGYDLQLNAEILRYGSQGNTRIETGFVTRMHYEDARLTVSSLDIGREQINAAGFIDLAGMREGLAEFGLDVSFGGNILGASGRLVKHQVHFKITTEKFDLGELQKRLGGSGWDISGYFSLESELTYDIEHPKEIKGTFEGAAREWRVRGVDISRLVLAGKVDNYILSIAAAEVETAKNRLLIEDMTIPLQDAPDADFPAMLRAGRAEFNADIGDIPALFKLFGKDEAIPVDRFESLSLSINGNLADGKLSLYDSSVEAAGVSLTVARGEIMVPASLEQFVYQPVSLTAGIEIPELLGVAKPFSEIPVNGRAAAELAITGSILEPEALVEVRADDLLIRDKQLGALYVKGQLKLQQERLAGMEKVEFVLTEVIQSNGQGRLTLHGPVKGVWKPGSFSMDGGFLVDGQGEIVVKLTKSPGSEFRAEVSTAGIASHGWLRTFLDGPYFFEGAGVEAVFEGPFNRPQVQLAGNMSEVGWNGMPFPLSGSFRLNYSEAGIDIQEFSWSSRTENQLSLKGFIPYDPLASEPLLDGDLILDVQVSFPAFEDIGAYLGPDGIRMGSLVMDVGLTGSWQEPLGKIHIKAESVEPPVFLQQYTVSAVNLTCDLAATPGSVALNSLTIDSEEFHGQATGAWQHDFTFKELLRKKTSDLRGSLSFDADLRFNSLNFLIKKPVWLRRFDGDTLVSIHGEGPVSAPVLNGSFSMRDGEFSHSFNFPMLRNINLQGNFDSESVSITGMEGEVGGSKVSLNGKLGNIREALDVDLQLVGKNVLLLREDDMQLRGDVQLRASGPLERLVISGSTDLTGGYYTRNVDFLGKIGTSLGPAAGEGDFLFSFTEPPLKDAVLDLKVSTVEPFRIRNNLVRGTLRPELHLKGTGELPYLVGVIYIDPSRVLLPSGRLQVQSGLVRFPEKAPDSPQLDLLASSKIQGYDISVMIHGPVDDPVITLSSNPPLASDDLLLLLLTGQPPQEKFIAGSGQMSRGTTNVMVYLGRDFLGKWLEEDATSNDETILDRFELDYGRSVTKSGELTIESTFRLTEEKEGKNRVYYLTGEKDRYDAFNYGLRVVFRFE